MSVCRYDPDGWLVQSERLSPHDTESARDALSRAPMRQEQPACSKPGERYGTVLMGNGDDLGSVWVVWESKCASRRGVFYSASWTS